MSRELHIIHERSNQVVEEPVATDAGNAPSDPAPIASAGDDQRERLDEAAGSEFVDDRIRLDE